MAIKVDDTIDQTLAEIERKNWKVSKYPHNYYILTGNGPNGLSFSFVIHGYDTISLVFSIKSVYDQTDFIKLRKKIIKSKTTTENKKRAISDLHWIKKKLWCLFRSCFFDLKN